MINIELDRMKVAVCEKLFNLIRIHIDYDTGQLFCIWRSSAKEINWSTEGLQVCHEAEKLLTDQQHYQYCHKILPETTWPNPKHVKTTRRVTSATYIQRLDALCRLWYPDKF